MKKLFLLLFFPVPLLAFNPEQKVAQLMKMDQVQFLHNSGLALLGLFFSITMVYEMYNLVTAKKADFFGPIAKYIIIFAIYFSIPYVVSLPVSAVYRYSVSDTDIGPVMRDFDKILMSLALREPPRGLETVPTPPDYIHPDQDEDEDGDWMDSIKSMGHDIVHLVDFVTNEGIVIFFLFLLGKLMLIIAGMTKYFVLDILWPIYFQLVALGFVFACSFAGLPRSGLEPIKKWFISLIEVASWPILWSITVALISNGMVDSIVHFNEEMTKMWHVTEMTASDMDVYGAVSAQIAGKFVANFELFSAVLAYLFFYIFASLLLPVGARAVVRSESISTYAGAVAYSVGGALMKTAGSVSKLAVKK